ncbi:putative leucine-rich repeat-containing protein DDB_G0290503 isoform X1 [Anopheles aquasalis]|uniref:putative leucine-rich repeat-containing protein DDB_G0290503 isoform X1 n=1 Tax=Anopheles aquasalis TaxID=42839 RepID=UPI00215B0510|nr:putative leucine-rich repeat-containing protein DDB_G0290503 isoform X1 [Anopheles aquasalis]XP_050087385.1 putative leucine-rich repeat-containing protein DDB_G0290503 isoform X1 [Anopheles aquasalis]
MKRLSVWVLLGLALFTLSTTGLLVKAETPSEYECRPYIEKAIQELKTESAEAPVEDVSQEDPIDVTSQEEEVNTAAEELSTEETDTATDDASDAITPSEEVQEQLFADDDDEATADSEPQEDDLASEATTVSEEEAPLSEEENADAEGAASEEIEVEASEENDETEEPAEASEKSANQVLEDSAGEDEDDENDAEDDDNDDDDDENQENAVDEATESTEQEEIDSQEQPSSVEEAAEEGEDDQDASNTPSVEYVSDENEDNDVEDVVDSKEDAQEQVENVDDDDSDDNDDNDENNQVEDSDDDNDDEEAKAASGSYDDREQLDIRESEENTEQSEENVKDSDSVPEVASNENEETPTTSNENDENEDEATASEETEDTIDSTENNVEENNEDDQDDDEDDEEKATSGENEDEENDDEVSEEAAAESEEQVSEEPTVTSEEEAVPESSEDEATLAEPSEEAEQHPADVSDEEDTESTEATVEAGEQSTEQEEVSEEEVVKQESEETAEKVEEIDTVSDETAPGVKDESFPEEDLLLEYEIPTNLRDTSHVYELLNINDDASEREKALQETADVILRDLKRIYDNSIKPLETLYKYRDLSNRHFGDPEIFSKPLVLLMGPWSGGKSTILNYLTHNEYTPNSVRTGAEPSPAYFNILMHGERPEVLDGTQLAADWTFSGLQKFGQGLLDRLRGQKLPNKLLERVNIVEIPGILEVRKQVSKYFPFNDACQWFIDRADIIFLVYDPSKLDVGPETEAILDQLKGREYQTRILLNKADQVKPEELLRVQSALIWNISPLMSSAQPPVMYTVSLWSNPYEVGAPVRLLQAQERTLLLDLGQAIEKRIENKIASARRFAVRVRNHAKMVDCYLTTYYNHKTLFGNKKQISEKIIASPQDYHIYEGLSTLTNISRYDLPDPEVYRDFFHLNPLYEFKKLSETCTYFRGCPINKLDVAIAYELPELVGKYKKMSQAALTKLDALTSTSDFAKGKSTS